MKLIDTNWDKKIISKEIDKLLSPYDDGELFVEEVFTENILLLLIVIISPKIFVLIRIILILI